MGSHYKKGRSIVRKPCCPPTPLFLHGLSSRRCTDQYWYCCGDLLVLMVVKEYINLFDFGTPVKNQMHISYAPAVSSKVTYADGTSRDVLKCANEKQCPSGLKCTTGSLVNLSENECKKSWGNVYTPALCNISHTRCASNTDCPQNEVCDKPTCMKRFLRKEQKVLGRMSKVKKNVIPKKYGKH